MPVVGIDVEAEVHHVAVVEQSEAVVTKPTAFEETAAGYEKLFTLLARAGARGGEDLPLATASAPEQSTLVVMEATGHYWQNLFAAVVAKGFAVAPVNPLRTHRFAGEELARTKTDRIDCLQIARFGAQKRPAPSQLPEAAVGRTARADAVAGALDARISRAPQSAASPGRPGFSRVHALSQGSQHRTRHRDPAAVSDRASFSRSFA
jgi:transposase